MSTAPPEDTPTETTRHAKLLERANARDEPARVKTLRQRYARALRGTLADIRAALRTGIVDNNVPRSTFRSRAAELLEMVQLSDKAGDKVKTYSGGMKRRLEIARGLLHHPDVLFLDEPTIGLDPQTRRHIWSYLTDLRRREGTTLLMTTHYIDEAENCDRIAIIDKGLIAELDTPDNLKAHIGGDVVSISTDDNARAAELLKRQYGLDPREDHGERLVVESPQGSALVPKLIHTLSQENPPVTVEDVRLRRPSLEDVFVHRTGHAIRDESGNQGRENLRQRMKMQGGH